MEMKFTQYQGTVPVTVLHLEGSLDGSNYEKLVAEASRLYKTGIRNLVLDLSKLTFLSSAGISSIHRVALMFKGKKVEELEEGWAAFRAMDRDRDGGTQQHVKLLNPSKEVSKVLEMVQFKTYFETYTDVHEAVASFH